MKEIIANSNQNTTKKFVFFKMLAPFLNIYYYITKVVCDKFNHVISHSHNV